MSGVDIDTRTTLRRAQRLAAKTPIGQQIPIIGYWRQEHEPLRSIDRLISEFGPDYELTWRQLMDAIRYADPLRHLRLMRRKSTSETAPAGPSPSEDAELHGGDGNSGEVPHPAESERVAAAPDPTASQNAGDREEGSGDPRVRTDGGAEQPAPDRSEASERGANPPDSEAPASADDPALGPAAASAEEQGLGSATRRTAGGRGSLQPTIFSTPRHGGFHADAPILVRGSEARRIYKLLARLVRSHSPIAESDRPGQRYSARRLAVEAAIRRCRLSRARAPHPAPKTIVLVCDCSGSCSAVCNATLGVCLSLAQRHEHVVALVTSNSWVAGEERTIVQWLDERRHIEPGLVVVFGDWDAGDQYEELVRRGADLIWFDSYAAHYGVRRASRLLRRPAAHWPRQPIAWYQGVNSAAATIEALTDLTSRSVR